MSDVPRGTTPDVAAGDEFRHVASPEPWWNESWYFDVTDAAHERGAFLRFGLYPNLGQTWMQFALTGRDRSLVRFADHAAPLVGSGPLSLVTPTWRVNLTCASPLRRWTVSGQLPGQRLDDPAGVYRGEVGTEVDIEFDLEWEVVGMPYHYGVTTRYELPCRARGTILVGGERLDFDGFGQRDHSWGVRDWWAFDWCWSAGGFDDGTVFHAADIRFERESVGFGYVQSPGRPMTLARKISAEEVVGAHGFPTRGTIELHPGIDVDIDPIAFAPVCFTADDGRVSWLPRALCRYTTSDGRTGIGWTEWNQVQDDG